MAGRCLLSVLSWCQRFTAFVVATGGWGWFAVGKGNLRACGTKQCRAEVEVVEPRKTRVEVRCLGVFVSAAPIFPHSFDFDFVSTGSKAPRKALGGAVAEPTPPEGEAWHSNDENGNEDSGREEGEWKWKWISNNDNKVKVDDEQASRLRGRILAVQMTELIRYATKLHAVTHLAVQMTERSRCRAREGKGYYIYCGWVVCAQVPTLGTGVTVGLE
ncbi:hypothetical protein BC835DRAFT_1530181 [Cytidiella melzeri]|nr:hypothetical protein BC835DRAFT_1530181 [Cytidiella melzeri]